MNLPNVTNLIKVGPTTNIFIINKADSTNRPSKFIENNDTNLLVDQTTMNLPSVILIVPT